MYNQKKCQSYVKYMNTNENILFYFILLYIFTIEIDVVISQQTKWNRMNKKEINVKTQKGANETKAVEIRNKNETEMKLISRILLEGAENEIDNVDLDHLIASLQQFKGTNIVPKCIEQIWNKLKSKRGISNIGLTDLMKWDGYFHYLPKKDIVFFIENHIGNTEFYGLLQGLDKQDAAIIMSTIVNLYEPDHFLNHTNINLIFGLICGLSYQLLTRIPDKEFTLIDDEVFNQLHSCSLARLRWLLEKMMKSAIFGPPQVWSSKVVKKLGMLLLALLPTELISVPAASMETMSEEILKSMDMTLIRSFTKQQIRKLSFPAFIALKRRLAFTNNKMIRGNIIRFYFLVSITLFLSFI